MSTYGVAGPELKKMIKVARKGPVSFGFNAGKDEESSYCGMHRTKSPAMIGKEAKDEGDGAKFTFGTALVAGKLITLTVSREMPGLAKKFKRYLKSQQVMLNVQIMDEDGNILDSDIEEGLPDDPDLEGEVEEGGAGADGAAIPAAAPLPPDAAAAGTDPAALLKRLGEIGARIRALPPEAAGRLAGPFKEVVELARAGDLIRAGAGADRIEAAIDLLGANGAAAAPPAAPAGGDQQKLRGLIAALRDKAGTLSDTASAARIVEALDRTGALVDQGETEQAVTLLKKIQQLFGTMDAAAPGTAPAGTAPGGDDARAIWDRRVRDLAPLVDAALSGGLVTDVDTLRKLWDWATGHAAQGAFDKAVAALPRIDAALAARMPEGQTAFEAAVAPDAQPFAKARVIWAGARARMQSEVKSLEGAIVAAFAGDDMLAEVTGSVAMLTGEVARLDARLEDKMDQIVNVAAGPDRDRLKGEARAMIAEYRALLEADFFKEVDSDSGFGTFAVTSTATAALAAIAGAIA